MKQYQIVSAPFPSGVTWLVNVLLELGIRTTHVAPDYRTDHWLPKGRTDEINPKAYNHLRWHLPVLQDRTDFEFEQDLEVFWEHRLELARFADRPTILFVRDPRDAVYSLYKRDYAEHYTFHQYLSQPATWPYHFPAMFRLPPSETWAYFHMFWLGMQRQMPVKVVRFEETRARPIEIMDDLLALLGVSRSRQQVQAAVERSSFDRAKSAMETVEQQTGRRFQTVRKGKLGEWKETYDEGALRHFEGPAAYAMQLLGYPLSEEQHGEQLSATSSLLELEPEADTLDVLVQAKEVYRQGALLRALAMLTQAAGGCDDPSEALAIASAITSLLWTSYVFSPALATSPQGQLAFDSFYRINQHFGWWRPVQAALLETVSLDNPLVRNTPAIIEQDYRGFSIALWRHRYFAFTRDLKVEDLAAAGEQAVRDHEDFPLLFAGSGLDEVISLVDTLAPSSLPVLVEEGYHGFNIVLYRGKYHALFQGLGPVSMTALTKDAVVRFQQQGQWFTGESADEVKSQLDSLQRGRVAGASTRSSGQQAEVSGDSDSLLHLAEAARDSGDLMEALRYLEAAIRLNLENVEAWILVGLIAVQLEDRNLLQVAIQQASQLAPSHPQLQPLRDSLAASA